MALKGTLADLGIVDLIQFPHAGRKTGHLMITGPDGDARLFYENGALVHASLNDIHGMDALVRIVDWGEGSPSSSCPIFNLKNARLKSTSIARSCKRSSFTTN